MRKIRNNYAVPGRDQVGMEMLRAKRHPHVVDCKRALVLILVFLGCVCQQPLAQKKAGAPALRKLPSAEKVVDNYLKAIGGKKRTAMIRDAAYEWTVDLKDQTMGIAKTKIKTPGSLRTDLTFGNGQIISGVSTSSAWVRGLDGQLRTLTGAEAAAARLQALLEANHLLDYKKLNVLARVISLSHLASEPAYIVEFSTRSRGRLRYWFSLTTNLIVKREDGARETTTRFADYRPEGNTANVLEAHRVSLSVGGTGELTLSLKAVNYNSGIPDSFFDPPRATEALNVPVLLREVGRNQEEVEKRVTDAVPGLCMK